MLAGGMALVAGPADAGSKSYFELTGNAPDCNPCRTPNPYYRVQGDSFKVNVGIGPGNRRPYVVQERTAGKWRVIRKKRTDSLGLDLFHVTHSQVGKYAVRAIAKRYDGHRRMVSNTMTWTVLLKTTVSATFSSTSAPANSSVVVTGSFSPASVRYAGVHVSDSRYGILKGWTMLSNPDGTFSIRVPTKGPGTYRFRVDVAQSDTEFAAYLWLPPLHVS
jgi:hypothetical protein